MNCDKPETCPCLAHMENPLPVCAHHYQPLVAWSESEPFRGRCFKCGDVRYGPDEWAWLEADQFMWSDIPPMIGLPVQLRKEQP